VRQSINIRRASRSGQFEDFEQQTGDTTLLQKSAPMKASTEIEVASFTPLPSMTKSHGSTSERGGVGVKYWLRRVTSHP
jgi:hypothetical protein